MTSRFSQGSRSFRADALRLPSSIAVFALLALAPVALTPTPALAHAHLLHAQPAAGSKVSSSPAAVTIAFSEGVVPRLSGIAITDAAGKPVAVGKPASAGGAALLSVAIGKTLAPGTYTVTWHAVSVDTHRTQGRFIFTVAP